MSENFKGKHVFLASQTDHFLPTILANMVRAKIIIPKTTNIIFFGSGKKFEYRLNKDGYSIFDCHQFEELSNEAKRSLAKATTITLLSLQPNNAAIAADLLKNFDASDKAIYIILTDDEIDRWQKLKAQTRSLNINKSALIDTNVLYILETVNNYIAPYNPWGKSLAAILDRPLNIIDAHIPFSILEHTLQETLTDLIGQKIVGDRENSPDKKVMLFTKKQKESLVREWLFGLLKALIFSRSNKKRTIVITIWLRPMKMEKRTRILISLIHLASKFSKTAIEFSFIHKVPPAIYYLNLLDHSYLILQDRGGLSSAKTMALSSGDLIFKEGSLNHKQYAEDIDCKVTAYRKTTDFFISVLNDDISNQRELLRQKLIEKRRQSEQRLKQLWYEQV